MTGTILRSPASNPSTEMRVSDELPTDETPMDDAQLVQATLGGEKQAFGVLVQRYQDRLFNTLLRFTGSRHDASDLVQDAFIQALVKLDTFRGDSRFYTWLYRIAMNLSLSQRRKRRPVASVDVAKECAGEEPMDQQQGPQQELLQVERAQLVQEALLRVGDEHRQILVLREMEGCSYDQMGEILSLPVGTVRSRLFRARMQLKQQLQELLQDETDQEN
jgi:RNA polymerase sigma-70 factor (ECF subfamily)